MKSIAVATALLIASLPLLSACRAEPDPTPAAKAAGDATQEVAKALSDAKTEIGTETKKALDEARVKLDGENITISDGDEGGKPKAEITPQGDFLIEGRKIAVNAEQRALLVQYRGQIATIAKAGIDIGMQGADLGVKAAGEALKGILSGDTKGVEAHVEKESAKIEAATMKLCDHMPAMLATQRALAEKLPEFKPYATMTQRDIDDCRNGDHHD
jgi:hypothetical protein